MYFVACLRHDIQTDPFTQSFKRLGRKRLFHVGEELIRIREKSVEIRTDPKVGLLGNTEHKGRIQGLVYKEMQKWKFLNQATNCQRAVLSLAIRGHVGSQAPWIRPAAGEVGSPTPTEKFPLTPGSGFPFQDFHWSSFSPE